MRSIKLLVPAALAVAILMTPSSASAATGAITTERVGDLRIRGIDVLQVVQPSSDARQYAFEGVPQRESAFSPLCGGGTPTAGRVALRLVVRDAGGRQDTASQRVTVAPTALELQALRAPSVAKGARRVTVSVKTNVPATLRAGGRSARVGSKVRRVRIALPSAPAIGLVRVPVRLTPAGGGQALRTTLVVLRG